MIIDIIFHAVMVGLSCVILVFNFKEVFPNLEASFIIMTWVIFTSHRLISKHFVKNLDELHDKIHELMDKNNDN